MGFQDITILTLINSDMVYKTTLKIKIMGSINT